MHGLPNLKIHMFSHEPFLAVNSFNLLYLHYDGN